MLHLSMRRQRIFEFVDYRIHGWKDHFNLKGMSPMKNHELLYLIRRQMDLLGYRTARLNPGPVRETLVARIERLHILYALVLAS